MDINTLIKRNKKGEFPEQKTDEWYNTRYNMITASEIASILDCNIYESSYDLLLRKLNPIEKISNYSMDWGNMFEPIAIEFYEFIQKEQIETIGLVTHSKYPWLGASPDGVVLSGKLLEIKCPRIRKIGGQVPLYYWIQMQIQMEVCNINTCDYFECEFYIYKDVYEYNKDTISRDIQNTLNYNGKLYYYKFIDSYMKTIKRDIDWFNSNVGKLQLFYEKMIYYRSLEDGINQLKFDSNKNHKRKRHDSLEELHKSKKTRKIRTYEKNNNNGNNSIIKWDNWVSSTRIRNFMIDDPLIDYLEIYKRHINETYVNTFQSCIMTKGITFEHSIMEILLFKYKKDIVIVANYQQAKSYDKYMETIEHMRKGVPIISQGVLHDYNRKLFGMPDLIVRSDWFNKLFGIKINSTKSGLNKGYHYRIIDIKYTSLILCSNGKYLRNSTKNIYAYKGQLYIYNKILGSIQNYTPKKSYILGKKWSYQKGKETFSGSSFEKLAHINYQNNDKFLRSKTSRAIKWIRKLNKKGHLWSLNPPSVPELKPNMCNNDDKWSDFKKKLAYETNDITELWMCNNINRDIAENSGVKNWRTHKNLTSEMLGIKGDKVSATLQLFIDMNQDSFITEQENEKCIVPDKIKSKKYKWREKNAMEFYVDFETIIPEISNIENVIIFMIGVGVIIDGKWDFKCFIADKLDNDSEKKILNDFHSYIYHISIKSRDIKLFHWGNAENYLYNEAMSRHPKLLNSFKLVTEWCDLLTLFKEEPIICRGMLNFSLKTVVKAFYDNIFIETNYSDSEVANGLNAMVLANECYNNSSKLYIMDEIKKYNEIDCKVMWEILTYLRKHH